MRPSLVDLAFLVVLCVVGPVLDARWFYPRFTRAVAAHQPGARARWYVVMQLLVPWVFTVAVLATWAIERRPWAALYLRPARPLGIGLGLGLSALYAGVLWWQVRALLTRPDGRERLRRQLASAGAMMPHTPGERRAFVLVAVTAGICEEILFRGFVMWCCVAWTGPIIGVVLSSVLFGIGHVYLGANQIARTGLVGLVMAGIVIAGGSLWPAIVLHAVIDIVAGELGYVAFSEQRASLGVP
jgi:membrane protease YdiL (CAAX protease family)